MPNTDPPADCEEVVRYICDRAASAGYAKVMVVGCATKGRQGEELSEMGALARAGVVGYSDDGDPIRDAHLMRRALEYSKGFGLPIIDHCEEPVLSAHGVMHEGAVSTRLGLTGIPGVAEELMVFRNVLLAEYTGGRLHIPHVSTKGSVEILRWAKARGITVTADTSPHYLTLTDEACASFDPNYKVNPPLRTRSDLEALIIGLCDGTIDCIATDHAPHLAVEKELGFDQAPPGMIGFETAFALSLGALSGRLSLPKLVARLSYNPAQVLGLEPPLIQVGWPAEILVIDPAQSWVYEADKVASKSRNSPFIGQSFKGKVTGVLLGERLFGLD
jgi:dihydroorotase